MGYGSLRSLEGINIISILNECSDLFSTYGGHKYAAGFSIDEKKIPEFKERFMSAISRLPRGKWGDPQISIEAELDPTEVSRDILKKCLNLFSPFGRENPYPVFLARNMKIMGAPYVTGGGNLRVLLEGKRGTTEAVGFKKGVLAKSRLSGRAEELREGGCLDVVFSPRLDKNNELYLSLEDISMI